MWKGGLWGELRKQLVDAPLPVNITYFWGFGSLLGLCLSIQIVTGIFLAMHYAPNVDLAFSSIEHIMRDVNGGWALRYIHSNGASMFFITVYFHIGRGLYYGSYAYPREKLWGVGVIILIVMMATMWPNWYIMDELSFMSIASFSSPKTPAIKRIGPHNKEVLSQIICGLLGDWWGNRIPSKGAFSYRFEIDQEGRISPYLNYLANWFYERGYCASSITKRYTRIDKGKTRHIRRLSLFTFYSFNWIYKGFYYIDPITNIRVKRVPVWIKDYLTPAGLAAWIMQDGSAQLNAGVYIATNNFNKAECEFLANTLHELFGLTVTVISAGFANQWRLNIWKESVPLLQSIVKDYMVPELLFKVHL